MLNQDLMPVIPGTDACDGILYIWASYSKAKCPSWFFILYQMYHFTTFLWNASIKKKHEHVWLCKAVPCEWQCWPGFAVVWGWYVRCQWGCKDMGAPNQAAWLPSIHPSSGGLDTSLFCSRHLPWLRFPPLWLAETFAWSLHIFHFRSHYALALLIAQLD